MFEFKVSDERPMVPLNRLQVVTLFLSVVGMGIGMTMNYVILAPIARESGMTEHMVGIVLSLSALVYAVFTPFWGRMVSSIGVRKVIAICLTFSALTTGALALALNAVMQHAVVGLNAVFLLILVRTLFGILTPGVLPASMAAMIDATAPATRATGMGLIGSAISIGYVLGPAGAALLSSMGKLVPLWGVSFVYLVSATAVWSLFPEPSRERLSGTQQKTVKFFDRRIQPYMAFLFVYFTMVGAIQTTLAWLVMDRYGVEGIASGIQFAGLAFFCHAIGMIIVQFGYLRRSTTNPRRLLPVGLLLIALAHLGVIIFPSLLVLYVLFFLAGTGAALVVPAANALASLTVPREEQQSVAASLAAVPPWGLVVAPILGAALYEAGVVYPLVASATSMGLLGLATILAFCRKGG